VGVLMSSLQEIALICFGGITVAVVIATSAVVGCVYWRQGQMMRQTIAKLAVDQIILRLVTVLAVVLAVSILALAGSLTEGSVSLFSAIIGFVLGGLKRPSSTDIGKGADGRTGVG